MAMRDARTRLELTWIGKGNRPRLEPRVLLEHPGKSYHAKHRVTDHDVFNNCLIFGDNLLALNALEAEFTGMIKCVYIDPPFNSNRSYEVFWGDTKEKRAFEDRHALHWARVMRDRVFG